MNNNTQLIAQIVLLAVGPLLAAHGVTITESNLEEFIGGVLFIGGIIWKFAHFNAAAAAPAIAQALPITKGNGMAPKIPLFFFLLVPLGFVGCTFEREVTTIKTPAVYDVVNGQTNLVSAASVSSAVKRERIWLPEDYSLDLVESGYGVHFKAIDSKSQTPGDIVAGVWYSSQRWTPTRTNPIFAPPITSSGGIANSGLPFTLKGTANFTAGQAQVQTSTTNDASGAIVPGVPNNQQK